MKVPIESFVPGPLMFVALLRPRALPVAAMPPVVRVEKRSTWPRAGFESASNTNGRAPKRLDMAPRYHERRCTIPAWECGRVGAGVGRDRENECSLGWRGLARS